MSANKKAIILFSGGLDSTTCLAIAREQGFACYALTLAYGQKHEVEVAWAQPIAKKFKVMEHKILRLPLDEIRGSSLTDIAIPVANYHPGDEIPATYVPARNTIFLSFALAWAEVLGAEDIFFGANSIDYSRYPDCRPNYVQAFEVLAKFATKAGAEGKKMKVQAPLLYMSKAEIIREGIRLAVDYSETVSCYRADHRGYACGNCDSCTYRKKGFAEAGIKDPTLYKRD